MRNPGGYATIISPNNSVANLDGRERVLVRPGLTEVDSFSCGHCGRITHILPKQDPAAIGGLCRICMKLTCPQCTGKGCDPLEKKLERAEARSIALRSYGL